MTMRTGLSPSKPRKSSPACLLPVKISARTGQPLTIDRPSGRYRSVSVKLQSTRSAEEKHILLARPGVKSASWITQGMPMRCAAQTTGAPTKPPLEKTAAGLIFLSARAASLQPFKTRPGSVRFFRLK